VVCGTDGETAILEKRFGAKVSIPTPADYDGDGCTDQAYYNPKSGAWRVRQQFKLKNFGEKGDIPVPGDYLDLGYDQPALFRPGEGLWLIYDGEKTVQVYFGGTYDIPVPADYDGDGITDFGTYDVRDGSWLVGMRMGVSISRWESSPAAGQFGCPGDIPLPADYDGDGAAEMAIFKPGKNLWLVSTNKENVFIFENFGHAGDMPVVADWDNDGTSDIAIFRPRTGLWLAYGDIFKARHGKKCRPLISSAR
jgi:hypothetical protein